MFWVGYLSGKGLSREVAARGQLDFESILQGNNLGVSGVSDKTGEEESGRVSEVSSRQREPGQMRTFWADRLSTGRWESMGF